MSLLSTNAEVIGAGRFWRGAAESEARLDHPAPFPTGTPIGMHLTVMRCARIAQQRMIYVVDTQGAKWTKPKCWSCGNKHNSEGSRACAYCGTPFRPLRFLMTSRWQAKFFKPFEDFLKLRKSTLGLVLPVALMYRAEQMHAVYHYNGESLLVDEPSALPGDVVLAMGIRLANTLNWLHHQGLVLSTFDASNVLVMPDGSVRWFDLNIERSVADARALYRDPAAPVARDIRNLAELLQRFVPIEDEYVASFLKEAIDDEHPSPAAFLHAAQGLLESRKAPDRFRTRAYAYSDVGLCREQNEDAFGWKRLSDRLDLHVIADGMGGHANGELASKLACQTMIEKMTAWAATAKPDAASLEKALSEATMAANDAVYALARSRRASMGTTLLAMAVLDGKSVRIAHAGDCRAYVLRGGELKQLTEDHTLVAELVRDGQITEREARNHPRANVVLVTVGAERGNLEFEIVKFDGQKGDLFLLCSDGLWGSLEDFELEGTLADYPDRRVAIQWLVRNAYQANGKDNLTLQTVELL